MNNFFTKGEASMKDSNYLKCSKRTWWIILTLMVMGSLLLSGCGAEEPKVYKVGVLGGITFVADIVDGFKAEMTELGYVEGENIEYDVQITEFDMATYEEVIKKFVEDDVDLIVTFPTEASIMAKQVTEGTDIPVLFTFALVEEMDLIDSIQKPGGNITGVRYPGPDIARRRFEIMHELVPDATRFLVPYQRGYPNVPPQIKALYPLAEETGIELVEMPADDGADLEAQFQAMIDAGESADAIIYLAEPLAVTPDAVAAIAKFTTEQNIPAGGALVQTDDWSTVFGLNVDNIECGKQTAPLADKILQGTSAGTIPVASAENFLQIDYTAAQRLGLEVPEGLLSQADEVIR